MEHVLLKATATVATDLGEFEAVISTEAVDREKDVVSADGMVAALHKWNRPIPLSWNHGLKPEDIFGHVDPQSARNVDGEVVINGKVAIDSKTGEEAWRSFKNRTVGFSFGYLIPDGGSSKRKGGGRHVTALDIFEVTATPAPMNNETRVLATKAMPPADLLTGMIGMAKTYIDNAPDSEDADEMRGILNDLNELAADLDDAADQAEDMGKAMLRAFTKAVWSGAYVNDLPDSSFLYIEPGGSKDSDGKTTPRSLRHFPVKDSTGAVDQAHVRNALSRIPQSNLPQSVKDTAVAKAQRMLDSTKSVDANGQDATSVASLDPLRAKADALALEFASDGESLRKAAPKPPAPIAAGMTLEDMRALEYGLTLATLSEGTSP